MKLQAPDIGGWRPRQWLAGIVAVLVLTLSPLAWIQWKQFQMLDSVADNQVDSIMWHAYQLERELSRLSRQVERAIDPNSGVSADTLSERYEVFLSRIDLLDNMPRRDLLEGSNLFIETMARLKAFTQATEPLFEQPQLLMTQPGQLHKLQDAIDLMQPQLTALTQEAHQANSRHMDERNDQLHQQGRLVITLAALQSLVLLLFVLLLVRYIRHQQQQYTQLKQLSRELSDARDQAEAANHGKSVFLANMSHEIRTPFQGLLGMLNLIEEPNLSRQQRDYLQTARDSALHLLGVLNDILDLSTMESGTLKLSVAPINLRGVVQEVEGLMQVAAAEKGLALEIFVSSELPSWYLADATRLRQILFNLINNAIKFTPHGRVTVEVTRPAEGQSGLCIHVRDTGMGMDSATLGQLFTRFYQSDSSLRRRIGGTGLGLEISRNLARMMGGDITVSSELGLGSVFTVTLPLPATEPPASELTPSGTADNRSLRVLVAEDHPINLKYMSILLEKMGHEAVFCQNGLEALQLIQNQPFDVVLLDYHMPELDGLATTEAIRMLKPPACHVKVILVTADVVNDTRRRALEAGVDEFVSKPLQALDLRRSLERCGLRHNSPAEEGQRFGEASPLAATQFSPFPLSSYEAPARFIDMGGETPEVVNLATYGEIFAMMPAETMDMLLNTLFQPPTGTLTVLLQALKEGNCNREAIGFHAHKLKGTALLLGFTAIAQTAARIEHLSCETSDELTAELAQQLVNDMEHTQTALRHFEMDQASR
jgi:signal transduction histidine kinase/FixJ family two-component response regulator